MASLDRSGDDPSAYGPPSERPDAAGTPEAPAPPPVASEGGAGDATQAWELPPVPTPTGSVEPPAAPPAPGWSASSPDVPPGAWGTPSSTGAPPQPPPPPGALPPGVPPPIAPWAPPYADTGSVPGGHGLQYGRTLDRLMAYWLDGLIVFLPTVVATAMLGGGLAVLGTRTGGLALVGGIIAVGVHLLYFVGFWTGGARATPGMRLMKLTIGDARAGATMTVQQGIVRWLALGGVFQLVQLVPDLVPLSGLLSGVWALALLVSTATSPTRQGLHDRIADTALVQPAGARTPAMACLVVWIVLLVVGLFSIVFLILLGSQVTDILSAVGTSI